MRKPETEEFLLDDLRELAASHAQHGREIEDLIPESISLGLFMVSMFIPVSRCATLETAVSAFLFLFFSNGVYNDGGFYLLSRGLDA